MRIYFEATEALRRAGEDWPLLMDRLYLSETPTNPSEHYIRFASHPDLPFEIPRGYPVLRLALHECISGTLLQAPVFESAFYYHRTDAIQSCKRIRIAPALSGTDLIPELVGLEWFRDGAFVPDRTDRIVLLSDYHVDPILFQIDIPRLDAYLTELNNRDFPIRVEPS